MNPEPSDPVKCPKLPKQPPDVESLVGLAFSGGGIRSASFNLGVLQALAERDVLWIFDYLSTVSGGGFIGSWWSAWLSRVKRAPPDIFPTAEELEPGRRALTARLLHADGSSSAPFDLPDGSRIARRDDPIHFLRLFSNYLTPKAGAFSPDTWRLAAFFVRNLIFTWVVLLPVLLAAVMAGQAYLLASEPVATAFLCSSGAGQPASTGFCDASRAPGAGDPSSLTVRWKHLAKPMVILVAAYGALAVLWLAYASLPVWLALLSFSAVIALVLTLTSKWATGGVGYGVLAAAVAATVAAGHFVQAFVMMVRPLSGASGMGVVWATADDYRGLLGKQQAWLLRLIVLVGLVLIVAAFGHDVVEFFRLQATGWTRRLGWGGVLTAVGSGAYTIVKALPATQGTASPAPGKFGAILMAIAPPLALVLLALSLAWVSHGLLLSSANLPAADRLHTLAIVAGWMGLIQVGFAVFESFQDPESPPAAGTFWHRLIPQSFVPRFDDTPHERDRWLYLFSPGGWVRVSVLTAIVVVSLTAKARWRALIPGAVLSVSTLALATLAFALLATLAHRTWRVALGSARPATLLSITAATAMVTLLASEPLTSRDAGVFLVAPLWIVLLIGFVICTGWLADPNLLSLHGFYKGRLSRAYLGASNTARNNEEITDAAPGDDIDLTHLWNHDAGAPYHLVNTTLSLVGGSDLAMSQRSAENFVMSRYHCGSARTGYRCTAEYMSGQLSLATAAAVSGAAVSPNMGSKTPSASLALFLSLFNVRLGFWAPTPSGRRWREPHARLWPFYVLRETLSNTGQIGTYCYLTDGGHFDNTGLYALVERGCRYIVVSDCGADPKAQFEDIGVAIRRCRIDFGAEIALRVDKFEDQRYRRLTLTHVVWGTIRYQADHLRMLGLDERLNTGVIAWIKPHVTPGSAADVRQYRLQNDDFPQQSTADQWYDESQFESYRRLGYESALEVFGNRAPPLVRGDFRTIPPWFDAH